MDALFHAASPSVDRLSGPFHLRFVVQPAMAALLAIRAGVHDARGNRPPYFWAIWSRPGERKRLICHGWKDAGRVFVMALAVDCIYQFLVFRWLHPLQALAISFLLAIVPYVLIRGPITRLACRWAARKAPLHGASDRSRPAA